MRRKLQDIITALSVFIGVLLFCSCSETEENYTPENIGGYEVEQTAEPVFVSVPVSVSVSAPAAPTVNFIAETAAEGDIPEITSYSENGGGILKFTAENVFSQGEYYTVSVIGEKTADENGGEYGNFRLALEKDGSGLGSLEIHIPNGDRLLIMDSVADGLTYGFGIVSNKRSFLTDEYPDIVQLEFYNRNDNELPQYARYFAVFDGKLEELPVCENGEECEPRGTHPELRGEGRMVQHLCVYTPSGKSLMVTKYEYIFDVENKRLNKRKVDFLGWNVDN